MQDLKPCPFCGGMAGEYSARVDIIGGVLYAVRCYSCGSQSRYRESKIYARRAWNRRTKAKGGKP